MELISIASLKGGVGKTTFLLNISEYLSKINKKILCIDLDTQGNLSRSLLNNFNSKEDSIKKIFYKNQNL